MTMLAVSTPVFEGPLDPRPPPPRCFRRRGRNPPPPQAAPPAPAHAGGGRGGRAGGGRDSAGPDGAAGGVPRLQVGGVLPARAGRRDAPLLRARRAAARRLAA